MFIGGSLGPYVTDCVYCPSDPPINISTFLSVYQLEKNVEMFIGGSLGPYVTDCVYCLQRLIVDSGPISASINEVLYCPIPRIHIDLEMQQAIHCINVRIEIMI